jgi:hypothetical protein
MSGPSEAPPTAPGEKHSFNWRAFVLWPCVVVILYVLSAGPVLKLKDKNLIKGTKKWLVVYEPVIWVYDNTFLHKPLGLYFHLWTDRFDEHGEFNITY